MLLEFHKKSELVDFIKPIRQDWFAKSSNICTISNYFCYRAADWLEVAAWTCLYLNHVQNISVNINISNGNVLRIISVNISPSKPLVEGVLDLLLAGNDKIIVGRGHKLQKLGMELLSHLGERFKHIVWGMCTLLPLQLSLATSVFRAEDLFLTYSAWNGTVSCTASIPWRRRYRE